MTGARIESGAERNLIVADEAERRRFAQIVAQARELPLYARAPDMHRLRNDFLAFAASDLARPMPEGVTMIPAETPFPAWWFRPAGSVRAAPLLYFHGGGFVGGSVEGARGMAGTLAQAFAAPVLAVAYRQAPEHPFPAAVEDARSSVEWLSGRTSEPITLAGDSAGAALAVSAALHAADMGLPRPRAAIAMSGVFDMTMSGPSWTKNKERDVAAPELAPLLYTAYLAGADPHHRDASPLNRSLAGAPPLLIVAGSHEVMADDSEMLAAKARSEGVRAQFDLYAEMPHNFVKFASPIADLAIRRMVAWEAELAITRR